MLQSIANSLVIVVFVTYWLLTGFFTLPDNYIKLKFNKGSDIFHAVLFQRWEFFAPPPEYNDYMYYIYSSEEKQDTMIMEVVDYVCKSKSMAAPFNSKENIMEYILSNTVIGITDIMRNRRRIMEYEAERDGCEIDDEEILKATDEEIERSMYYETLVSYANVVAEKNNIPDDYDDLEIMITRQDLPKFHQRLDKDIQMEELLVFRSNPINRNSLN